MNQLQAMRIFLRVVDLSSFHLAARQLGISAAAVTRSVSTLEAHLNARLLNRSTRSLSLTEVGRHYVDGCRAILSQVEEVESDLMRATHDPIGSLRIAAPASFAGTGLGVLLQAYRSVHTRVEFDVTTYDARIDMIEGGFDVCFSMEKQLNNSSLVSRQLTFVKEIAVASPAYLARRGTPRVPGDLNRHDLLTLSDGSPRLWDFADADETVRLTPHGILAASSCTMVRAAALEHMGIAVLPAAYVEADLARGTLVPVLGQYQINGGPQRLSILYPSRSYLSAKVRTFIDFVVAQYRSNASPTVSTDTAGTTMAKASPAGASSATTASPASASSRRFSPVPSAAAAPAASALQAVA